MLVVNDPKYVNNKTYKLTSYALEHAEECCLRFNVQRMGRGLNGEYSEKFFLFSSDEDRKESYSIDEDSQSYIKWNSMDKEPLMCGVILYSKRENKIYDGSYIGDGRFYVNDLTVDKSNFDCWVQRETFFKESGLRKFLDDSASASASDTI